MPCVVCGNTIGNATFTAKEMMFGYRDKFEYVECSKCGCLQISGIPADLGRYYPKDYWSSSTPHASLTDSLKLKFYLQTKKLVNAQRASLLSLFDSRHLFQQKGLAPLKFNRHTRILDVGCGNGELIYFLAEAGIKNPVGIDAYIPKDISYKNGAKVFKSTISEDRGKYDLIMFQHSFEHMPNQLDVLSNVNGLLADEGFCLINMPTTSSYAWKHYRQNWVQLDAPRHLCLHSKESIAQLAQNAKLKVSNIVYNSTSFQFWGSIQYEKDIPLRAPNSYWVNPGRSNFSQGQILDFELEANKLNQKKIGDSASFYLTKINSSDIGTDC